MKRSLDLNPDTLVQAYAQGLFPMDVDGEIRWFSPNPRAILPLDGFHAPSTLRQLWRQKRFEIRSDTCFREVMCACGERREGTWISGEIVDAYCRLFELGLAHSLEIWQEGGLAGGLYGVHLGGAFFGESMFHRKRDASKLALMALVQRLREKGFTLLDVQFATEHLERFGVIEISRPKYLRLLTHAISVGARW
jgi:leucyl/phenylalanyl-tRNA--protein transferase